MTATNNLNVEQLTAVLELIYQSGLIDRRYTLGIVTEGRTSIANGTHVRVPARAHALGDTDPSTPIIWIYNDNTAHNGQAFIGNWEGIAPYASRSMAGVRRVANWGLYVRDANEIPAPLFSKSARMILIQSCISTPLSWCLHRPKRLPTKRNYGTTMSSRTPKPSKYGSFADRASDVKRTALLDVILFSNS